MNEAETQIGLSSLVVKAFGISDTGQARPSNEDQFLIVELTTTMRIWEARYRFERYRVAGLREMSPS